MSQSLPAQPVLFYMQPNAIEIKVMVARITIWRGSIKREAELVSRTTGASVIVTEAETVVAVVNPL